MDTISVDTSQWLRTTTENRRRALRAFHALLVGEYDENTVGEHEIDSCDMVDFLTDLMHLCHQTAQDFGESLRIAKDHFKEEAYSGLTGKSKERGR
jgi:hypothetical protein